MTPEQLLRAHSRLARHAANLQHQLDLITGLFETQRILRDEAADERDELLAHITAVAEGTAEPWGREAVAVFRAAHDLPSAE